LLGFLFSSSELGRWEVIDPIVDVELLQEGSSVADLTRAIGGRVKDRDSNRTPPAIDIDVTDTLVGSRFIPFTPGFSRQQ